MLLYADYPVADFKEGGICAHLKPLKNSKPFY